MTRIVLRTTAAIVTVSLALCCCSRPSSEEAARAEAMAVAQTCCDRLLEGDYDGFLAFMAGNEDLPHDYREQLKDAYRMYIDSEMKSHRGITGATVKRAQMDSTMNVMQVFVVLDYGDNTHEEIVMPMVSTPEGQWIMK